VPEDGRRDGTILQRIIRKAVVHAQHMPDELEVRTLSYVTKSAKAANEATIAIFAMRACITVSLLLSS
jgi:hypothetical protein